MISDTSWHATQWAIRDDEGVPVGFVTQFAGRYGLIVNSPDGGTQRGWFQTLVQAQNAGVLFLSRGVPIEAVAS